MQVDEYQLRLDVDFRQLTFRGRIRIVGEFESPTATLNSVDLEIVRARSETTELVVSPDPINQEVHLEGVPPGTREVEIAYHGRAGERLLTGMYRSVQPPDYILSTQFESIGARRLFPCFDRPDQKAVFDAEVTVDADRRVVFNTPPIEIQRNNGRKRIRFARTPRMPTYVVYLGIGQFDVLRESAADGRVAAWVPPGEAAHAQYALDLARRLLRECEEYYGVPYPLAKLDLVSVREMAGGAMENWGAIACKEMLLLADGTTTSERRQTIGIVLAHEIAHMWFGNLVTMRWWDDIWLNESFATFMSYKLLERVGQISAIWNQFLLRETSIAFVGDSLSTSHPIRQAVRQPEEIDELFDEVSYGKGASVLRMLEAFVGEEAFGKGVNEYLRRFQFGNARSEDLWAALETATQQPVTEFVRRWIESPGHPVLKVHRGSDGIHVEQRRFSLTGRHPRQFWPVPLLGRTDGKPVRMLLTTAEVTLSAKADAEINLNAGAFGFYRVLYDPLTYDQLHARFDALPLSERWGLVRDLLAFLLSGDLGFDRYAQFLDRCVAESDPLMVQEVANHFLWLEVALADRPRALETFRRFHRTQSERLGLSRRPYEPEAEGQLRERMLLNRIRLDPEFERGLARRFPDYDRLDADVRGATAIAYARVEGAAAFEALEARVKTGSEAELQRAVRALGSFDDSALIRRTLELADRREILLSHIPFPLIEAVRQPAARPAVWDWYLRNTELIRQGLAGTGLESYLFEEIIPWLGISGEIPVQGYFRDRDVPGANRGIRKGLEYLEVLTALRDRIA